MSKSIFLTLIIIVFLIILLISIAFVLEYVGIKWMHFFGVQRENVRREMFEETKSYNQGMEQNLAKYYYEYRMVKSEEEKKIIASTIRQMYGSYDENNLNLKELVEFLKQIKYGD